MFQFFRRWCLKTTKIAVVFLFFFIVLVPSAYADPSLTIRTPSIRSQVAKILLSSFGGAVLGLSTLSFYDNPEQHLNNVALGGAAGAIIGSIYVTQASLGQTQGLIDTKQPEGFQIIPSPHKIQLGWVHHF